jgi:hypothetical protein
VSTLGDRLLAIHHALDRARIPHAVGGAIALAYCTNEPRGTRDIDLNVFVDPSRVSAVFAALPDGVRHTATDAALVARDGQVRLFWDDTPVDLFFAVHQFHHDTAGGVRWVPFEGETIPVLGCGALVVFKAMFNRTKDWADIEAIAQARSIDGVEVQRALEGLMGADDPVAQRLAAVVAEHMPS